MNWEEGYRVFISHESSAKVKAAEFKRQLEAYGISAFLAHEDILPTRLWEEEIKNALSTMHAFVALLTKNFHNSDWTDQEVGHALCRGVPVVPVRLGLDPYGFIGRLQAITVGWEKAPLEVVRILIAADGAMVDSYIEAVVHCRSFDQGNRMAKVLEYLTTLSNEQVAKLLRAFNDNDQVNDSFGFRGRGGYGKGLKHHLERITGNEYFYLERDGRRVLDDLPF